MDKKHEKYKAYLTVELPDNITGNTLHILADNGITQVGQLMDRWEMLNLVTKDRRDFKAMLKGFGIRGGQVDNIANYCATFEYQLQANRESQLLYQKIGGKYIPVESLTERSSGWAEGIYLVRVNGKQGYVRSVRSLLSIANEVGWFKVAGKPTLDFEPIAKLCYYADAISRFLNKENIRFELLDMSISEFADHLAKLMLEVTENENARKKKDESAF